MPSGALGGRQGVLAACDGGDVGFKGVGFSLGGRGLGLRRQSSPVFAPSGRRIGPWKPFTGWWALGRAWWGEVLAPLQGEFPGVLGAPVGLVLGGGVPDGLGVAELQGLALCLVRGASALVELLLAVPGHPDLYSTVWAWVLVAVLDRPLTADQVAPVVVAERLLDFRMIRVGTVRVAEGRMIRMLGLVRGGPVGRPLVWLEGSGLVRGVGRLLFCRLFWPVRA